MHDSSTNSGSMELRQLTTWREESRHRNSPGPVKTSGPVHVAVTSFVEVQTAVGSENELRQYCVYPSPLWHLEFVEGG